jgi:hypothetical protein
MRAGPPFRTPLGELPRLKESVSLLFDNDQLQRMLPYIADNRNSGVVRFE